MRQPTRRSLAILSCLSALATPAAADDPPDALWSMATTFEVETLTNDLCFPWNLAILPDGDMLVTGKFAGTLRRVSPDGVVSAPIARVPEVCASENGGLLGIALDPGFAENRWLYLVYAERNEDGDAGLAGAGARLSGGRLEELSVIFRQTPKVAGDQNYGGRLLFAPDGTLFVFAGNRFAPEAVKHPSASVGTVVRIHPDGSIPDDNPFVGMEGFNPAVWSRGHRNSGAAAFHPETHRLVVAEFGPWGGDELNLPYPGSNHGWPHVNWGEHQGGGEMPDAPTRPEFDREIFFWNPTIGPSGEPFHDGSLVRDWEGSLLIGGLTSRSLVRLTGEGDRVLSEERLRLGVRIRDVAQDPDGALLLLTDEEEGRILRPVPKTKDDNR